MSLVTDGAVSSWERLAAGSLGPKGVRAVGQVSTGLVSQCLALGHSPLVPAANACSASSSDLGQAIWVGVSTELSCVFIGTPPSPGPPCPVSAKPKLF